MSNLSYGEQVPSPLRRFGLSFAAIGASIVLPSIIAIVVILIFRWDIDVPSGLGDDFGRVAGQLAAGAPLDHNRIPMWAIVYLALPLWACLIGVPWLFSFKVKLNWRRDFGWGFAWKDIPIGVGVGLAAQFLVIPAIYWPLSPYIDAEALEAPARELVAAVDSVWAVLFLFVLTVVGAPIAEEILYRGLLHRALSDWFAKLRWFGVGLATLTSSFVFAASHFQILQFPGLMAVGIVLALAFQCTKRLGTVLWMHAAFNATSVVALLIQFA